MKVSDEQLVAIRERRDAGESLRSLAREHGISHPALRKRLLRLWGEYDSGNPRHVLASALAYECGDPSSEARYRRQSITRLASIAAARLTEAVDERARVKP